MKQHWKWYVYILLCNNKTYYTGCTWNLSQRYQQHLSGKGSKYTARFGVKKLVYSEEHTDLMAALQRERQIKDWSQKKKEKLIKGIWDKKE